MAYFGFTVQRNDISPVLSRMAATARNPRAVLLAMGNTFKSITEGNFNSAGAGFRPAPWPAKKDGSPSNLKKSGLLWHSFHLQVTDHFATLSNPTPYAARHQFGDARHVAGQVVGHVQSKHTNKAFGALSQEIRKGGFGIPPRPFYPVLNGRLTQPAEQLIGRAGERAVLRQARQE